MWTKNGRVKMKVESVPELTRSQVVVEPASGHLKCKYMYVSVSMFKLEEKEKRKEREANWFLFLHSKRPQCFTDFRREKGTTKSRSRKCKNFCLENYSRFLSLSLTGELFLCLSHSLCFCSMICLSLCLCVNFLKSILLNQYKVK